MAEDRCTVRGVVWREVIPGLKLVAALKLAISFRAMLLAFCGIVLMAAGWRVISYSFGQSANELAYGRWPWEQPYVALPEPVRPHLEVLSPAVVSQAPAFSPPGRAFTEISRPFIAMFGPITWYEFAYNLVLALWAIAVWALCGGAISRMAAVRMARDEQLSWGHTLGFAQRKWIAYFAAPLFPMIGVLLATVPLVILGLIMRTGLGMLLAAVVWPLALLAALLMAILLIGLLFGWPLMWGTISSEGSDTFDALSRSYAYTYQRPILYLVYAIVAAILGTLGWLVAWLFATAVTDLSQWAVSWGSGNEGIYDALAKPQELGSMAAAGARGIQFWLNLVAVVPVAFAYSFFWTSSTAIYFLLRRSVDATEMDEVYLPEEGDLYGLPPLATDSAGVPHPADDASAATPADG